MRSQEGPEGSHEPLPTNLATILVAVSLAAASCSGKEQSAGETHPYPAPSVDVDPSGPRGESEEPVIINYDHPFCAEVRAAKAALDEIDDPVEFNRRAKRGRSRWVDTESKREADRSRSDRVMVGSGSGTPDDVRRSAEASQRFFRAARAAGGLERATAICLERRHVLSGKPPKGK